MFELLIGVLGWLLIITIALIIAPIVLYFETKKRDEEIKQLKKAVSYLNNKKADKVN